MTLILNRGTYFKIRVQNITKEKGILEIKQLYNHRRIYYISVIDRNYLSHELASRYNTFKKKFTFHKSQVNLASTIQFFLCDINNVLSRKVKVRTNKNILEVGPWKGGLPHIFLCLKAYQVLLLAVFFLCRQQPGQIVFYKFIVCNISDPKARQRPHAHVVLMTLVSSV